ncbi:MAG: PilT/PilU family type 4a pilus ATPase [Actinobacteria bacterium]|nr:PilT/PilU family type 4a pilus ATPase [Actinomycetota bacterium]
MDEIVKSAVAQRASDIHIATDRPVRYRIDGRLTDADEDIFSGRDCEALAEVIAGEKYEQVETIGELDLARTLGNNTRCRINLYRSFGNIALAIRILSSEIPPMENLGLPPVMMNFPNYKKGIILITGETGSGKSTTLASVLDRINHSRPDHIITLEDPIEYIYTPDKCSIDQREIGKDTKNYASGLRASLREDPDVILIGEMRDLETIETALTAAETGHLVFATLHTNTAADAIDRIVDVFPAERQYQARLQLSQTLQAVVSQELLLHKRGVGRVLACEVMMVNPAIRNLIREAKTPQIQNTLATSAQEGSITMDNMLLTMVKDGRISKEVAIEAARDPEYVTRSVRMR